MNYQLNHGADLNRLRADINTLLNRLEGVKVAIGNMRYEGDGTGVKMTLEVRGSNAPAKEAKEFRWATENHLLDPIITADLGRNFVSKSREFTLIGYSRRARKFPFLAQRHDGAIFKFTKAEIIRHLGYEVKP